MFFAPVVLFDLAYNTKHSKSGVFSHNVIAILTALLVAVLLSLLLYFLPEEYFGTDLPYQETLILALTLSTVNSHDSNCIESKSMATFTNTILILLIQYVSNPGEHYRKNSWEQIIVMILYQTLIPLVLVAIFSLVAIIPIRFRLAI